MLDVGRERMCSFVAMLNIDTQPWQSTLYWEGVGMDGSSNLRREAQRFESNKDN